MQIQKVFLTLKFERNITISCPRKNVVHNNIFTLDAVTVSSSHSPGHCGKAPLCVQLELSLRAAGQPSLQEIRNMLWILISKKKKCTSSVSVTKKLFYYISRAIIQEFLLHVLLSYIYFHFRAVIKSLKAKGKFASHLRIPLVLSILYI